MAQFARPDSNVTQTNVTGGYAEIDEATASDADFAYSANNTSATLTVSLSNPTDPASSTGHVVRYRYAKTNAGTPDSGGSNGTLEVVLMQGAATIIARSGSIAVSSGTWAAGSFTLTGAEADAITDYTDLRLYFDIVGGGGSPASRRGVGISWAELEVPDVGAGSSVFGAAALSASATVAALGALGITGQVSLSGVATFDATGRMTYSAAAGLAAEALLAAVGSVAISGAVSLSALATMAAASGIELRTGTLLTASASVSVVAALLLAADASLSANATLTAVGTTGNEPLSGPPRIGTLLLLKIGR